MNKKVVYQIKKVSLYNDLKTVPHLRQISEHNLQLHEVAERSPTTRGEGLLAVAPADDCRGGPTPLMYVTTSI